MGVPGLYTVFSACDENAVAGCIVTGVVVRHIPVLEMQGGVVQEEHLQRLQLYGRCVRRLRLSKFNEPISSHVFSILSRSCHPNLTPGLQSLSIPSLAEISIENLNGLFLLLSSRLHAIGIDGIGSPTEILVASWLRETSTEAPLLRTLSLSGLAQTSLDVIPAFKALTALRICVPSYSIQLNVLKTCSEIKTLRTLCVLFDRNCVYSSSSVVLRFPNPQCLHIAAPVIAMGNLFGTISAPNAVDVTLRFLLLPHISGLEDVQVAACLERCAQNTRSKLSSIDIQGTIFMSWKALLPLAKVSRLTMMRLRVDFLLMTDEEILGLFCSQDWLKLQRLELTGLLTRPGPSALSPLALGIIAKHCPSLSTIKLAMTINTETTALEALKVELLQSDAPRLNDLKRVSIVICKASSEEFDPGPNDVKGAAIISRSMDQCFPGVQVIELTHPNNESGQWLEGVYEMLISGTEGP